MSRLTVPEAVGRLHHCLPGSQSAWVVGPRLIRRFANVGLSAWELACHALPTKVLAAQRLFALSVSARYRPPHTVPSGTQRARLQWLFVPKAK